jgi:1-acyl-sn-glycerol-3-phosphate acyltransferase
MSLAHTLVLFGLKTLTRLLARIHDEELDLVPDHGPLILITNHINTLEVPLIYTHLLPRRMTGFVAEYRWDIPFERWLLQGCGMIRLQRGEADLAAIRVALERLKDGYIFAIAPEGTRSKHGCLQRGHPGVVLLALKTGTPLLPLVFYGHEGFQEKLRKLQRPDFWIAVGKPFILESHGVRVTREVRKQMTDEIMYQIAALLPPANRGVFSDLDAATERYLNFL